MQRILILFITLLTFVQFLTAGAQADKPYVIVISFDAFRWDYPDRGITPNIDKMIADGVRAISFQPAFPSKTFPNHYSIATGLYPQNHGLVNNRFMNPATKEIYKIGDSSAVKNDMWYQGETLWASATREGVRTASYYWVGSETQLGYKHPTYFKSYNHQMPHENRIQGIVDWLAMPEDVRPHLLFLYFADTDDMGHRYGPDSKETNEAIELLDSSLGQLREKLKKMGMLEKVNIILLSDHGMTPVSPDRAIKLYDFMEISRYKISGYGPLLQFFTDTKEEQSALVALLEKNQKNFSVYTKETIPHHFHYAKHSFIGDVILIADLGYSFIQTKKEFKKIMKRPPKGDHGYDNFALDMHGIFIASGPAFKENYKTGTLLNVDVYPLVCRILGITGNQMIDGRLERITPILK